MKQIKKKNSLIYLQFLFQQNMFKKRSLYVPKLIEIVGSKNLLVKKLKFYYL